MKAWFVSESFDYFCNDSIILNKNFLIIFHFWTNSKTQP